MRDIELEAWVLKVLDRAAAGQPNEDFRIEFKSEWLDAAQAARRLAGHANAARGDRVLWIIGADKDGKVVGASREELANWWPQVQARFDEVAPTLLRDMNVHVGAHTVVALLFESVRAPFVVKAAKPEGSIQREVPWREGTAIRSAHRQDVVRLLSPLVLTPEVEVIDGSLSNLGLNGEAGADYFLLVLEIFVTPRGRATHFPVYRLNARLSVPGTDLVVDLAKERMLDGGDGTVTVERPSTVTLQACGSVTEKQFGDDMTLRLELEMGVAGGARAVTLDVALVPAEPFARSNVLQLWKPQV